MSLISMSQRNDGNADAPPPPLAAHPLKVTMSLTTTITSSIKLRPQRPHLAPPANKTRSPGFLSVLLKAIEQDEQRNDEN